MAENKFTGANAFHQIFRADGKNCFIEVINNAFEIGKVQINSIQYDPANGNKQSASIPCYMNVDTFEVLVQDFLSGRIPALAKKEKEKTIEAKKQYANHIFEDMGGIPSAKLSKERKDKFNFDIPEGMAISRIFRITPSLKDNYPWVLSGQIGLGKENASGLIVPQGAPKEIVRVPMTDESMKKMLLTVKRELYGFTAAQYMKKNDENNGQGS